MSINIELKKVGYLYRIDKNDYDLVYWFTKEQRTKNEIKEFIMNIGGFDVSINAIEYEILLSDFNLKGFLRDSCLLRYEIEDWKIVYDLDEKSDDVFDNSLLKESKCFNIKMPITDTNKINYLREIFNNIDIFSYDGRNSYLVEDELEKLKELIKEIEETKDTK